jgi:hypothetical protein
VTFLVRLYPKSWRARYGDEFAAILDAQPASLGLLVDVLAGALDARLHPRLIASSTRGPERTALQGVSAMTEALMTRCAAGGPQLSTREQYLAGGMMMAAALLMGTAYVLLRHRFHATPAVEAVGYSIFPGIMLFYTQAAYLRHRPAATQAVFLGGGLGAVYLLFWAACAIAFML